MEIERKKARRIKLSQWWKSQRSTGKCHYCEGRFSPKDLTMDHKVPLSRGGKSSRKNLVPCCPQCNMQKMYLTAEEWAAHVEVKR